jgi:hypothetical protein
MAYRFVQPCPTCGRHLEIRVELLGKLLACQHCAAEFVASDLHGHQGEAEASEVLLDRVDQALRRADEAVYRSLDAAAGSPLGEIPG